MIKTNIQTDLRFTDDITKHILAPVSLIIEGEIDEGLTTQVLTTLFHAHESGQTFLPVYINSVGGSVDQAFAALDLLKNSGLEIITIGLGCAMSAGSLILSVAGDTRYISENTRLMIHEVTSEIGGEASSMENGIKEINRLNNSIFDMLDKCSNKDKGYFKRMLKDNNHSNVYLTPKQAKSLGLIDQIKIPTINMDVKISLYVK